MTVVSIAILLSVWLLSAIVLGSWRRRVETAELGTVSARWLAEHRANDRPHSAS